MKKMSMALGAVALAAVALAGEIAVTGSGTVMKQPDKMKIVFAVSATDKDMAEARRLFGERTDMTAEAFAVAGIATNEVTTAGMEMHKEYSYENGRRVLSGFTFSETYTFTAKVDRTRLARINAALFECQAIGSFEEYFELFDTETVRSEARAKAVANAREIAEGLAKAAGVRLGKIQEIEYGEGGGRVVTYSKFARAEAADFGGETGSSAQLKDIEVSDSVRIRWKIK